MTGKPSKRDWAYMLRQQQGAAAGRKARTEKAESERAVVPTINIDKRRITLPGLRFMGEEPHPAQIFTRGGDE